MCVWQARALETLRQRLRAANIDDIKFIIVNSQLPHAQRQIGRLYDEANFPVHQDTSSSQIWNLLQGGKDDIYVYDRCGRLTYYVPFPRSMLFRSDVGNAIMATYNGNRCNCTLHETSQFVIRNSNRSSTRQEGSQDQHRHHQRQSHHQHHGHHHHQRRRPRQRRSIVSGHQVHLQQGDTDQGYRVVVRQDEESSNIHRCRQSDALCHILYRNAIRYRRAYKRVLKRRLNRL